MTNIVAILSIFVALVLGYAMNNNKTIIIEKPKYIETYETEYGVELHVNENCEIMMDYIYLCQE